MCQRDPHGAQVDAPGTRVLLLRDVVDQPCDCGGDALAFTVVLDQLGPGAAWRRVEGLSRIRLEVLKQIVRDRIEMRCDLEFGIETKQERVVALTVQVPDRNPTPEPQRAVVVASFRRDRRIAVVVERKIARE
jgi:hypothetical protein